VSNRAVLEKREDLQWPADMYLEGSDQHRGWFQSSLLPAVAIKGTPPYRSVVTHGYVVDGEGRKLSKKLGNFMELPDMLKRYGADILRLWVASENYRQDIRLSDEILTRMQDAYKKLRNTFRFALGNLSDFSEDDYVPYAELWEVDRWALHKAQALREAIVRAYGEYEFHQVFHAFHNFCTIELSSFYFDVLKDRLYTYAADSVERRAAQTVIAELLVDLVQLAAPILPHTTDEVWEYIPGHVRTAESVHLTNFPPEKPEYRLTGPALQNWNRLLRMREIVSKVLEAHRRQKSIGASLEASVTIAPGDAATETFLREYLGQLPSVVIVSQVDISAVSANAAGAPECITVSVARARGEKCVRCWNYRESVGTVLGHPQICSRCAEQLGVGE
jgi:isoleucyl-tRNA synthetase